MAGGNSPSGDDYSFIDRLLHRMAFAHPVLQRALGEIESDMFAEKFAQVEAGRPVFVTGLPRAGTTLLLESLYSTGEFATFTYREMPFLLAPLFWSSVTKGSRKAGEKRERAHGDGMEISFDSPEAFEEVAWRTYLGDCYLKADRLAPIKAADVTAEFRDAFAKLIRKLVAAQSETGASKRYLSKNNANISRIDAIGSIFSDAAILICLRDPQSHVRSLMSQHERFLGLHDEDDFARDYMRWIGHYDFGANFRPIDFAGRAVTAANAASVDFWLRYWIDAYAFVEARAERVSLVCYEKLLADPAPVFAGIAARTSLESAAALTDRAGSVRAPTTGDKPLDGADAPLLAEAKALYERLRKRSLG